MFTPRYLALSTNWDIVPVFMKIPVFTTTQAPPYQTSTHAETKVKVEAARKRKSNTDSLNDLVHSNDKGLQTDIAILDFSKAFDTVPHEELLCKLESIYLSMGPSRGVGGGEGGYLFPSKKWPCSPKIFYVPYSPKTSCVPLFPLFLGLCSPENIALVPQNPWEGLIYSSCNTPARGFCAAACIRKRKVWQKKVEMILVLGSNMIFHSLTFARSRGRCWKPRAKPEVFNISRGSLRMLMNDKIMFDPYYCINSKKTHWKLRKCLRTLFFSLTTIFLRTQAFYKYPRFGPWPGTFSHDDLKA